jgi:outer membrane lipoprotein-sorting protein
MKRTLLATLALLLHSMSVLALPSGDEIADRVNARDEGLSVSRLLRMELTDKRGKTRVRETKAFRVYEGQDKKTAIFYLSPNNVKDTAFLTYDYAQASQEDDQWLYLPAMKKVRRISASDRGDYFLGTDFTFEEIKLETRISKIDYSRKTLSTDSIDGHSCIWVESIPASNKIAKELGIGRRQDCIDDSLWMIRKSEQWDTKDRYLKTIIFSDIRRVDGIWTAHSIKVENHQSGHKTHFEFSDVDYSQNIPDSIFTANGIKRGI